MTDLKYLVSNIVKLRIKRKKKYNWKLPTPCHHLLDYLKSTVQFTKPDPLPNYQMPGVYMLPVWGTSQDT